MILDFLSMNYIDDSLINPPKKVVDCTSLFQKDIHLKSSEQLKLHSFIKKEKRIKNFS